MAALDAPAYFVHMPSHFLHPLRLVSSARSRLISARRSHRLRRLRGLGMYIGRDVNLPDCCYIDEEYCALIHIGDSTSISPECMILAHDDGCEVALGAVRVGRVVLHESVHVGARTVILPGVEIGTRTVIAANSVVSRSLPAETVCAGRPARPFCTLAQYLETHARRIEASRLFEYDRYSIQYLTPERQAELVSAALAGDAYIIGGRSAELQRTGGSERTPLEGYVPPAPRRAAQR